MAEKSNDPVQRPCVAYFFVSLAYVLSVLPMFSHISPLLILFSHSSSLGNTDVNSCEGIICNDSS